MRGRTWIGVSNHPRQIAVKWAPKPNSARYKVRLGKADLLSRLPDGTSCGAAIGYRFRIGRAEPLSGGQLKQNPTRRQVRLGKADLQ